MMRTLPDIDELVFDPPELGCILYLPGLPGGGAKIYDRSPYSNHGVITGASWNKLPSGLWCLSFDGTDDYINCGSASGIANIFDGGGTAMAWIKADTDGEGDCGMIFNKGWYFHVNAEASGLMYLYFCEPFSTTVGMWRTSNKVCPTLKWTLVTVTYNADSVSNNPTILINGVSYAVAKTSAPVGTRTTDAANPLLLGNNPATSTTFDGLQSLWRIYNRVLSALEIQHHFNQGKYLFGVW